MSKYPNDFSTTIHDNYLIAFRANSWIKYKVLKWLMSDTPKVKVVRK